MGRGANATHAAYNGSGTQGIAVTDKINENEETRSVFITENDTTKQILHGHNISEMTCAGKSDSITTERYKIFTPDENSDMLGDVYLNFEMDSEISDFTFVDTADSNTEYNMYNFTDDSRKLDLKLAGSELKSLDVNLNTREISEVIDHVNLDDLGFEVVNQTKFFEISDTMYQFIVGKAKNEGYNFAWREYSSTNEWQKLLITEFQEINCLILETQHPGVSGIPGIMMFGGLPSPGYEEALLYGHLADFPDTFIASLIPFPDFPKNSDNDLYYKIVYTLEYFGERPAPYNDEPGRIIISGSKDHTGEVFERVRTGDANTPDASKQTCIVISNYITSSLPIYVKIPFIVELPYTPYYFDPIVSSSFSNDQDEYFITLGDKSETLLGIDSDKKLIRSYDNGKTWARAPFYHGDGNSPAQDGFYTYTSLRSIEITNRGRGYTSAPTVTISAPPPGGRGATASVKNMSGGNIINIGLDDEGSGYLKPPTITISGGGGFGAAALAHDPGFNYYIPELDYLISDNVGHWFAVGKQGIQPGTYGDDSVRDSADYYRQFIFYSENEGYTWNPYSIKTLGEWDLNYKFHNYNGIVEYLEPQLLTSFGDIQIPFKVSENTLDYNGNALTYSTIIPIKVQTHPLPVPPALGPELTSTTWPFGPGPYDFSDIYDTDTTFDFEYIGVTNNGKRPIYYGFNSSNNGLITSTQSNSYTPYSSQRRTDTRTTLFENVYPRSIKYAHRDLYIGVFSDTNGDPGGTSTHTYKFKKSIDGITWDDIKINNNSSISSTRDPLIEGDKYGNFIVGVINSDAKYNLYRYDLTSSNLEVLFDDLADITDVYQLNFVSNEWMIALSIGNIKYLLKSYDLKKWRKNVAQVDGVDCMVNKIYYKPERRHDIIYRTSPVDETISPYKPTDVVAYNIIYNPDLGGGVFPYKNQQALFQGSIPSVTYKSVDGNPRYNINHEPNDIINVNGKIFMCCNGVVEVVTRENFNLPLVEQDTTNISFIESETIYGINSKIPVTVVATNLRRLYSSPIIPETIFAVGYYSSGGGGDYGVILYRTIATPEVYKLATEAGYYWRVLIGPPPSMFPINKEWITSGFSNITDVVMSKTNNQMVVVGKSRTSEYNLVIFDKGAVNIFDEYTTQLLDFEEIYTVSNLGNLWVVGGKPKQSDEWNNKCVAYTFNLIKWNYIDFTPGANTDNVTLENPPYFTVGSGGTLNSLSDSTNFEANDIKLVELQDQTAILLQISFNYGIPLNGGPTSGTVGEKIYFMYINGVDLIIKQNNSYPEPSISFADLQSQQNRKQLVPSFTTIINDVERRFVATDYPNQFNMFYVTLDNNNNFRLSVYHTIYMNNSISESGTKPTQRFRKFIQIDENSIIKKTNGHCYKIAKVKNENFVTGVNSAKYVSVGKGNFSAIVWSDDLLTWKNADVSNILDIAFDVTHKHGMWVAIGAGNYNLAISKDGKKWTGVYTKYSTTSPEITTDGTPFFSLDFNDPQNNNITDILPYVPELKGIFLRNLSILRLFSRIEYHVGTQIWQTLTFDDVKAMLDTEFGSGEYKNLSKNCSIINKNGSTRLTVWIPGFTKTLNSKLETFVNLSESGSFPSGLLKDQKLSIKIYYNKLENIIGNLLTSSDMNNAVFDNFMNNTLIPCDRDPNYFIDSFLADNYGFQLGDTYQNVNGYFKLRYNTEIQRIRLYSKRFELDDIEIDIFNQGIRQYPKITQSLYSDADNVGELLLDLDSFNLYTSHIIVSGWLTSGVYIKDMNLELNGYSYHKTLEPSIIDYTTKSFLGLNYNGYIFNGVDKEDGIGSLVIPLASTAYSGSCIPLDRYSSIRLKINFTGTAGPLSYINVTCVGTTTISYNNSTANIDLY